jgi:hypothetical protein
MRGLFSWFQISDTCLISARTEPASSVSRPREIRRTSRVASVGHEGANRQVLSVTPTADAANCAGSSSCQGCDRRSRRDTEYLPCSTASARMIALAFECDTARSWSASEAHGVGSSRLIERAPDDFRPTLTDRFGTVQPSSRVPPSLRVVGHVPVRATKYRAGRT